MEKKLGEEEDSFIRKHINTIICGDTLETLRQFPDECIDMVITSPPYYGLRNYNVEGQIGLEKTFQEYLDKLIEIMKEIKRVLKKVGTIWINLGDCYGGQPAGNKEISKANIGTDGLYVRKMKQSAGAKSFIDLNGKRFGGMGKESWSYHSNQGRSLGDKCLLMQPERFAIRCIDEVGLILRNKIVWAKQVLIKKDNFTIGSVMPTSVKNRFNESYEFLYFFVKSKKYYSDLDAVRLPMQVMGVTDMREPVLRCKLYPESKYNKFNYYGKFVGKEDAEMYDSPRVRTQRDWKKEEAEGYKMGSVDPHRAALRGGLKFYRKWNKENFGQTIYTPEGDRKARENSLIFGKNIPTVWHINPEPHNFQKELKSNVEHFAMFPKALLEIPVRFGCPPGGIVLDPFIGSGTTAIVAKKLGRNFIGIELSPEYCELCKQRLNNEQVQLNFSERS